MSDYARLYEYCQTLQPKISRTLILNKTLEITAIEQVKSIKTGVDTGVFRGMFLSATNTNHRIVEQLGCNVIVLARGQTYCWERFVYTKELMHLFDTPDQLADTHLKLDTILGEFEMPSASDPVAESEYLGFWMALACLCPEKNRLEFEDAVSKNHTDYYSIALQLRIPEQYVPFLFQERYRHIIDDLIS